jgi:uncharacterized repeat protein (TIGR03837 family)
MPTLRWDLFCRVIDNHGDLGVCWRLARQLAARGQRVRLWVDDPTALTWMAPAGAPAVELLHWTTPLPRRVPGDVVIEAFGCDPPPAFIESMTQAKPAPLWINLEYLSAESYVERCHRLPSPQLSGPAQGLAKWFFYPGFSTRTGGLLREDGLLEQRRAFDAAAWLRAQGIQRQAGERLISVFCYENAPLAQLMEGLCMAPAVLLVTPGAARQRTRALLADQPKPATLRGVDLPWLPQPDYDHLLWSCDLNIVRGEDSLVRALWAGVPFLWQVYPQEDGAHAPKLDAFLDMYLQGGDPSLALPLRRLWRVFNGLDRDPGNGVVDWPDAEAWRAHALARRDILQAQPDLTTQLMGFADEKR